MQDRSGAFISLEGLEACGKTTFANFIVQYYKDQGIEVVHVREPGGTPLGEKIRNLLINDVMGPQAELLLFMASRLEIISNVIKPALDRGAVVVSERFMDSTYALQGFGRDLLQEVMVLDQHFLRGFEPDLTFNMRISVEESTRRQELQGRVKDRFETAGDSFHTKVAQGFEYRYRHDSNKRIINIDAEKSKESVFEQMVPYLEKLKSIKGLDK